MKKLLILLMVFGMTSIAGAALQISVNGNLEPIDSQINLTPSQHAILDIWTDTTISSGVGELSGWALVVDPIYGSISGGIAVNTTALEPGAPIYQDAQGAGMPGIGTQQGVWGMIALSTVPTIPAGEVMYDEIDFHCETFGDAVINLYGTDDWGTSYLIDSVIIHQIPEPMTMALLGLGGLGLLRRRR